MEFNKNVKEGLTSKNKCFETFIINDMISIICDHTNNRAEELKQKQDYLARWKELDNTEFTAFLRLLLIYGVEKGNDKPLHELWSPEFGIPVFRATMSMGRFQDILRCLQFDDKETREARKAVSQNKAEAIRAIFEMFTEACRT